ncbi:MAG: AIR synthase-related protein [Dokdonella sp.]
MDTSPADDVLIVRLNRPQPRVAAGIALRGLASACIDISDGLLADLGHIASASGIGFEIGEECLPATNALFDRFDAETCRQFQLSGGDDYELAFTIAEADVDKMRDAIAGAQCRVSRIGRVIGEAGVHVLDRNGARRNAIEKGWEHFK